MPNVRSFAVVRVLVPVERVEEARRVLAEGLALPEDAEVETEGNPTEAGEK
jgi:hypothetical protein